jgi:hypothetical protein
MRTIKHVWSGLPEEQRKQVLADVVLKGGVSISTVYIWMQGRRNPLPLYQDLVSNVLGKVTGEKIPVTELFPNKK